MMTDTRDLQCFSAISLWHFEESAMLSTQKNPDPYQLTLETKYRTGRLALLVIFTCTALSMILNAFSLDVHLLFGAFIPYLLILYGNLFTGRLPESYYENLTMEELTFLPDSFLVGMMFAAAFVALLFLLAWFFSRAYQANWLLFSLVLYALDSVVMLLLFGFSLNLLADYILHGIAIGILASATVSGRRRRIYLRAREREENRPPVRSRYLEDED